MATFDGVDDAENTGTGEQGQEQQAPTLHPSWQPAYDAIPEDLRDTPWGKGLVEKISESERNARKAIDDAKGAGIPEEWAGLIEEANGAGLSPSDLADAFNSSTAMRDMIANDPDAFLEDLKNEILASVESGAITPKEGSKLMAAGKEAADEVDLQTGQKNPELEALQKRLDERDRRDQEAQTQWEQEQEEQQAIAEAEKAGEDFISAAEAAFQEHGLAGRTGNTKQIIAQVAAGLMDGTDATPKQAMDEAIKRFQQEFGLEVTVGQTNALPIGGGSSSMPAAGAPKFESDKDRTAAMLAEAARQQNAGIN
jgi:hypothetical protein